MEKTKKPRKLTLGNLRTWLKTQDPKGSYDYSTSSMCLMAQFGRAMGYDVCTAGSTHINVRGGEDLENVAFPLELDNVAYYPPREEDGFRRTFGGALAYLEREYGKRR